MPWRYQPVFTEEAGERIYSICEVYFDDAGKLTGWTENEAAAPGGEDVDALTTDIASMLNDAFSWVPIRFSDLGHDTVFRHRWILKQPIISPPPSPARLHWWKRCRACSTTTNNLSIAATAVLGILKKFHP